MHRNCVDDKVQKGIICRIFAFGMEQKLLYIFCSLSLEVQPLPLLRLQVVRVKMKAYYHRRQKTWTCAKIVSPNILLYFVALHFGVGMLLLLLKFSHFPLLTPSWMLLGGILIAYAYISFRVVSLHGTLYICPICRNTSSYKLVFE